MEKLAFPLSFFPDRLQLIIKEVSDCYGYPIDHVCCAVLSVSATAIGSSNAIQIKKNWIERPSIFIALVASPGINKSASISWAMMPIEHRENELYKQYLNNCKDYDRLPAKERDEIPEPVFIKTVISDATPEAVVQQLHLNTRGVLAFVDELSGFLTTFQRYNKGNDEQFYLSAWSGKTIVVDRKTSRSIRIKDPVVNISGTIQPDVLEKCFIGREASGFYDRWLLCHPPSIKKKAWNTKDIDWKTQESYDKIINNLLDLSPALDKWDNVVSRQMTYSSDALSLLMEWQKGNTDFINDTLDDVIKAIRAKIEIYVHRFALVCELISHASEMTFISDTTPDQISIESVKGAIDVCEYFVSMAINIRTGDKTGNLPQNFKDLLSVIPFDAPFTFDKFLEYAEYADIPEGTARKFLAKHTGENKFFSKIKHGIYART